MPSVVWREEMTKRYRKWIVLGVAVLIVAAVSIWLEPWLNTNHGFVTGVATAVIALFTATLWWNSDSQLQHGREVERAYFVCGGVIDANGVFLLDVANYGKTRGNLLHYDAHHATNVQVRGISTVLPVAPSHPYSDAFSPGGEFGRKRIETDLNVPSGTAFIYGAIWYEDVWKDKHCARFILEIRNGRTWPDVAGVHKDYTKWT
jgi:hypothetical protein